MKGWQVAAIAYVVAGVAVTGIGYARGRGLAPAVVVVWPWTLYQWAREA